MDESFTKLSTTNTTGTNVLSVADYFAPFNNGTLNSGDTDLGSGGNVVLPDSVGSAVHPHLPIGAGKEGRVYLIDRDNMGHFNSANDNQIVQWTQPNTVVGLFGAPAYFNNTIYYLGGYGDHLKAFRITHGQFGNGTTTVTPISQATGGNFGFPGSSPSISANGTSSAIVWVLQNDAYGSSGPGILHAYNATNLANEIYNSSQAGARDRLGGAVKFTVPTIANGKVYVGSEYRVSVFGLAGGWTATPTISPNGGVFTNSVTVTISTTTPGASIYYTLDGSIPTTSSSLYTSAFTITNSGAVKAFATKPGLEDSSVTVATFLNSTVVGNGTGLTGRYWSNQLMTTNGTPTLTRIDSTVNSNWGNNSPDPSITADHFTALWTGQVQAQFNETYTFYTTTDDGVRCRATDHDSSVVFERDAPADGVSLWDGDSSPEPETGVQFSMSGVIPRDNDAIMGASILRPAHDDDSAGRLNCYSVRLGTMSREELSRKESPEAECMVWVATIVVPSNSKTRKGRARWVSVPGDDGLTILLEGRRRRNGDAPGPEIRKRKSIDSTG